MINATVGELYDRCVRNFAADTAITYGSQHYTYAELGQQSLRLARGLQDLGVGKGQTVAFLMGNCPEYVFCEYALAKIGAVRVPLSVMSSSKDHVYMVNEAQCTTIIYHASMADRVAAMAPELKTIKHFVCIGDARLSERHVSLESLITNSPPKPRPTQIESEDLAGIYFTGGTTPVCQPEPGHYLSGIT